MAYDPNFVGSTANISQLALKGSVSGSLLIEAAATTTNYTVFMPSAQGIGALYNDGTGNLAWSNVFLMNGSFFEFAPGSAATPGMSIFGNTNTGLYQYTTNALGFSTNGISAGFIDPSQNWTMTGNVTAQDLHARGALFIKHSDDNFESEISAISDGNHTGSGSILFAPSPVVNGGSGSIVEISDTQSLLTVGLLGATSLVWPGDGSGDIGSPDGGMSLQRPNNIYFASGLYLDTANITHGTSNGTFPNSFSFSSGSNEYFRMHMEPVLTVFLVPSDLDGIGVSASTWPGLTFLGSPVQTGIGWASVDSAAVGTGHALYFNNNSTKAFSVNDSGMTFFGSKNIYWATDGAGSIGALSANRPDNGHFRTAIYFGDISQTIIWQGAGSDAGTVFIGTASGSITSGINNTVVGYLSGFGITTGSDNTLAGNGSGFGLTSGTSNVYLGSLAGRDAALANQNVAIGVNAGIADNGGGNVFIGYEAGASTTSVASSVFIGSNAGQNATGSNNTALGYFAGVSSVTGQISIGFFAGQNATAGGLYLGNQAGQNDVSSESTNTFIGHSAGSGAITSSGVRNTALGTSAMTSLTSGSENTVVGFDSGSSLTSGGANVFIGSATGASSVTGFANVYIGSHAGAAATTDQNTYIGYNAGGAAATGANNVAIGLNSGGLVDNGGGNVFIGVDAGSSSTSASSVFIGFFAGLSSTGTSNVFVGSSAGQSNTAGQHNVFVGTQSGYGVTTGAFNIYIGDTAGLNAIAPTANVAIGYQAGQADNAGFNVFIGNGTAQNNTGTRNTFLGNAAGLSGSGDDNVGVGYEALDQLTTGNSNIALGLSAGNSVTSGNSNTILGANAGSAVLSTGSYNILLGVSADVETGSRSNTLVVGSSAHAILDGYFGGGIAFATGVGFTFHPTNAAGTDITAVADFIFAGAQGTGTGYGGDIVYTLAPPGLTGSSPNSLIEVARFTPQGSALFALKSTTQGFVTPKMTTAQRDAIGSPIAGLEIYNTSSNKKNFYDGTTWEEIESVGTGTSVSIWTKYTVAHTALQAASLTNNIQLFLAPVGTLITGVVIKQSVAFAGTGITAYTISVGITGTLTKYAPAFDVFQAVSETAHETTVESLMAQFGATTSIRVAAVSTGANLNQSTAGSVDIWVQTVQLP